MKKLLAMIDDDGNHVVGIDANTIKSIGIYEGKFIIDYDDETGTSCEVLESREFPDDYVPDNYRDFFSEYGINKEDWVSNK